MAVAFAQPTDVVKVRFQAQARLPKSTSVARYSSTIDAYKTIARDEGVKGLWKGERGQGGLTVPAIVPTQLQCEEKFVSSPRAL